MKTELCLRDVAGDRILGSVVLAGRLTLAAAIDTPQAQTLLAARFPGRRQRAEGPAANGYYWSVQDSR